MKTIEAPRRAIEARCVGCFALVELEVKDFTRHVKGYVTPTGDRVEVVFFTCTCGTENAVDICCVPPVLRDKLPKAT